MDHISSGGEGNIASVAPLGGVLVILKNAQVAFASPTLKLSSVEPDVVERRENQSFLLEGWQQMFQASNQGDNVVMSFQDIKQEVKVSRNLDSFWTPAKKKKVLSFDQSLMEDYVSTLEYSSVFDTAQDCSAFFQEESNSQSSGSGGSPIASRVSTSCDDDIICRSSQRHWLQKLLLPKL
jgi:hypothetical protein